MRFSKSTKDEARFRQYGRCGACGLPLDEMEERAHHIYPNSLGGADEPDNCVILCWQCEQFIHNDGNYRSCIVAQRDYFEHFNG
jgi:5-methylcytosine-specific restriction endonuclease McrA